MIIIRISKLLDMVAYLALVAVFAWYFFAKPLPQYISIALLGVCILKLAGAMLKSNFFEKEYKRLKEENDFLTETLKNKE
ncbi:MAG: hypothetical protein LBR17_02755 [Bacteroidales bacterium]|jgi:uncharacterized membrane protein YkvI|nr:hypothetical protein [Bacteroidales bacterium]